MTVIGETGKGREIAGWVVKVNPKAYRLDEVDLNSIDNWAVQENVRSEMMAKGQPIFLWRTGKDAAILTSGQVNGRAFDGTVDPDTWINDGETPKPTHFVPVKWKRLDRDIPKAVLKADPAFNNFEVFRSTMMGNPNILDPRELAALEELVVKSVLPRRS